VCGITLTDGQTSVDCAPQLAPKTNKPPPPSWHMCVHAADSYRHEVNGRVLRGASHSCMKHKCASLF